MKKLYFIYFSVFIALFAYAAPGKLEHVAYVPDEITAIKIAEAVLIPVFGESRVVAQKPYKARFVDGLWIVTGSIDASKGHAVFGGVLSVHINKSDGKIIDIFESI